MKLFAASAEPDAPVGVFLDYGWCGVVPYIKDRQGAIHSARERQIATPEQIDNAIQRDLQMLRGKPNGIR